MKARPCVLPDPSLRHAGGDGTPPIRAHPIRLPWNMRAGMEARPYYSNSPFASIHGNTDYNDSIYLLLQGKVCHEVINRYIRNSLGLSDAPGMVSITGPQSPRR